MNKLASIRIFVTVAQCLSFADAAKQLRVSSSVVTRGVAMLEKDLDVRLVNRTTRHVSLTPVGKQYLEYAIDLMKLLESMDECVADATQQPAGCLRISASASFASTDLPHLLTGYRSLQPRMNFELSVFETMSDIDPTGFDICFNAARRLKDSSLICKPIAQTRDVIVASPTYLERNAVPRTLADLASHDVLLASDAPSRYWEFRDRNGTQRVVVRPIMNLQSPLMVKNAACAGLGIARLPRSVVMDELSDGRLRMVLNDAELCESQWTVWLLYSSHRHMPIVLRAFIDFVAEFYEKKSVGTDQRPTGNPMQMHPSGGLDLVWSGV